MDPLIIPIVAIVGAFATISIGVIAHYIYLLNRLRAENSLKQDMLLRGYSAEQIAEVISATGGARWSSCGERRDKDCSQEKNAKKAA
jgi:hypothetical protein